MGCDIHGIIQKKTSSGWETLGDSDKLLWEGRNYELFGALAGVRCTYVDPIQRGRGKVPEVQVNQYGETTLPDGTRHFMGDHSFGWVTFEELLDYEVPDVEDSFLNIAFELIHHNIVDIIQGEDSRNFRWVFGFDS